MPISYFFRTFLIRLFFSKDSWSLGAFAHHKAEGDTDVDVMSELIGMNLCWLFLLFFVAYVVPQFVP